MPREPDLSEDELAEIARRRAAARSKARRLLETADVEEDAAVILAAQSDPDALPMTDEQLSRMRPAHEVLPDIVAKSLRRNRGRPKLDTPKQQITLRIDPDILQHFKSAGAGWQTAINDALRSVIEARRGQP